MVFAGHIRGGRRLTYHPLTMTDLSYRVGYATDGRARCELCKSKIHEESLRLAAMVLNEPKWFHGRCFFQKHRPKSISDVAGASCLHPDDQEKIHKNIGDSGECSGEAVVKFDSKQIYFQELLLALEKDKSGPNWTKMYWRTTPSSTPSPAKIYAQFVGSRFPRTRSGSRRSSTTRSCGTI